MVVSFFPLGRISDRRHLWRQIFLWDSCCLVMWLSVCVRSRCCKLLPVTGLENGAARGFSRVIYIASELVSAYHYSLQLWDEPMISTYRIENWRSRTLSCLKFDFEIYYIILPLSVIFVVMGFWGFGVKVYFNLSANIWTHSGRSKYSWAV